LGVEQPILPSRYRAIVKNSSAAPSLSEIAILKNRKQCEDDDIGGPNCSWFTGPIAVYRFVFAMVLFFGSFMLITCGAKTSRSFRAHIHNGFVYLLIIFFVRFFFS
jgi:hypothetical protein